MDLASRVFDVITDPEHVTDGIRASLPEIAQPWKIDYWRRVLRMAALCHDMGHLPFSHAAEDELLPKNVNHESLTQDIIRGDEMFKIWEDMTPPLRAEDIVKLAVGPKKAKLTFTNWERILSEIIVGDAFGVDRMDYLLRDSYHIGVAYGKFDHYRLIDTLRILPSLSDANGCKKEEREPTLGVEEGGMHSVEALLLARYFMFSQVYYHHVRRIYDIHLVDFLKAWLPGGKFKADVAGHCAMTDNEVNAALMKAANDLTAAGHDPACRLVFRQHFKLLWKQNPDDTNVNPEAGHSIFEAAKAKFGADNVRYDKIPPKSGTFNFPVLTGGEDLVSSLSLSDALENLPIARVEYVFIIPERFDDAKQWLHDNRKDIIKPKGDTV
jgi:HD superfamily phosphohydrolase